MGSFGQFDFRFVDLFDIFFVAVLIYWVLRFVQGTRAAYMLVGLAVAVFVYFLSSWAEFYTLNWILSSFFGSLLLVVVVIFQNDIRRALTEVGRSPFFSAFGAAQDLGLVEELVRTSVSLANKKIGAIIVLERTAEVAEYVDLGTRLDAFPSKELITSIFLPLSPIHDGAILIQKGKLTAAGCFLPLTMNPTLDPELGTRHRAAIGLTEETDAVVIVVSEEKGWISLVVEGQITRGLDGAGLRKLLLNYFRPQSIRGIRQLWYQRIRPLRSRT